MADGNRVPPTLRDVQRRLFALVTRRAEVDVGVIVRSDDRLDAAGRVQVYANMYRARLVDILRADFPKLAAVLGEAGFERLAAAYLEAFPSRRPSVRHVGGALAGFLEAHAPGRRGPWLAELARLEWARVDVHDRADDELLTWEDVRGVEPARLGGLRLALVQAHVLVPTAHRVTDVWRRVQEGRPVGRPARRAGWLLVWRQDGLVYHRVPSPDEAALLAGVASGTTFAWVCERLAAGDSSDDAARRAADLLATWTGSGLLSRARGPR